MIIRNYFCLGKSFFYWSMKNRFNRVSTRNFSLGRKLAFSSEYKKGWFENFPKQTKSAVIPKYKRV